MRTPIIKHQGLTLVELMIGITLSLFITLVIQSIYVDSKKVSRSGLAISRIQENGRYSVETLANDIRMAGFIGCRGQSSAATVVNTTLSGTAYQYGYSQGIYGFKATGSTWIPTLDASITALTPSPLAGSDVMTVWGVDQAGLSLTQPMTVATDALQVGANTLFNYGDIGLISDCNGRTVFQVTSLDPQGTGILSHAVISAQVPSNSTTSLQRIYSADAMVYRVTARTYYVGASSRHDGRYSLWRYCVPACYGTSQLDEVSDGVEDLTILYGVDTDGDGAANKYVGADTVNAASQWGSVVSVKAQILFATTNNSVVTSPQTYTYAGVSQQATDLRLRVPVSTVITLRNRAP